MGQLSVIVAADLQIEDPPEPLADEIQRALTYPNPAYQSAIRYNAWTKPPKHLHNFAWESVGRRTLCVPRGYAKRLRKVAARHGHTVRWVDLRTVAPARFPARDAIDANLANLPKPVNITDRQQQSIDALVRVQNAYLQASTGYGKTVSTLLAIAAAGQRALYLVPGDLTRTQVLKSVEGTFGPGFGSKLASKPHKLTPIMIATYDLAWNIVKRRGEWFDHLRENIGALVCDEAHMTGAPTRVRTVGAFGAKYRWGATATPERKDGMHTLVFDLFGEPADVISYEEAIAAGRILRVQINVVSAMTRDADYEIMKFGRTCDTCDMQVLREEVPEDKRCECGGRFEANSATADAAMNARLYDLADETLRNDPERTEMIAKRAAGYHKAGHSVLILARRIQHSERLLAAMRAQGVGAVLLRGGAKYKRDRECNLEKLQHGEVRAAVGTSTAFAGMDVDRIDRGIVAIPSANNAPQLKQMRGRFCRLFEGKEAQLDYIWDRYLFPQAGRNLRKEFGDDVTFEDEEE